MNVFEARNIITMDKAETESTWMLVDGDLIVATGSGEAPSGERVRLDGVVYPGFIDAHVHLTTTGLYRMGLDFRGCRSVTELLDLLTNRIESTSSSWVIGGNFDPGRNVEDRMPTRDELDRITSDRHLLISRADGHSCAVNSRGLDMVDLDPSTPGVDLDENGRPTGVLRNQANYEARRRFFSQLPEQVISEAQRAGCALALEHGVTSVHEMAGGSYMGNKDFEILMRHRSDYPIHVLPYLATFDIDLVVEAGLRSIGGDLFLDGSIGSRTAAMGLPYEDDPGQGSLYHSDEEVGEFFRSASRAGLQAGVHAIGDAAIEQAMRSIEKVSNEVDIRGLRHRIEHFECTGPEQLARAKALGVAPSVQPMFDRYWGGREGMYFRRLGKRSLSMNPFRQMIQSGMRPAGGSDSTVTPLDPLLGIQAAIDHHIDDFRVEINDAIRMFTTWAAFAGHDETARGSLEPGKRADFCLLSDDLRAVPSSQISEISVLETWVGGEQVFAA